MYNNKRLRRARRGGRRMPKAGAHGKTFQLVFHSEISARAMENFLRVCFFSPFSKKFPILLTRYMYIYTCVSPNRIQSALTKYIYRAFTKHALKNNFIFTKSP